jgi:Deoxyribonuclease NucA/NucB
MTFRPSSSAVAVRQASGKTSMTLSRNGAPTQLTRVSAAVRDSNRAAALRGLPPAPAGQSLDEYPFACSAEGGCGAFVRAVPVSEQSYQGGVLSSFFQRFGISAGDLFNVDFEP